MLAHSSVHSHTITSTNSLQPNYPRGFWHGRYRDETLHRPARGRFAPRRRVEDRLDAQPWVVDLDREKPSAADFVRRVVREMRIRFYQARSVTSYRHALTGFLRWFGAAPSEVTREDVRDYLELLVDGGASASWVSVHVSALRTIFDKMCGRSITLGLATPRKATRLPVVLTPKRGGPAAVRRALAPRQAAPRTDVRDRSAGERDRAPPLGRLRSRAQRAADLARKGQEGPRRTPS